MDGLMQAPPEGPLIAMDGVSKSFAPRRGLFAPRDVIWAVKSVSLIIRRGETVGLLGESGSGKTTVGRLLLDLTAPTQGEIRFAGERLDEFDGRARRAFRRRAQLIFQNPFEAFNPRFSLYRSLSEPLLVAGIARSDYASHIERALELAGFRAGGSLLERFPHELSGGQLQRCVIARAMMLAPEFIVADEPVSMLDVSVRAGILNLLRDLKHRQELTALYISHDITLIRYLCERTVVMHRGEIVEDRPTEEIIRAPLHPYTQALIAAVPRRRCEARIVPFTSAPA